MKNENKLLNGMMFGALIGGMLTLLDKGTRQAVVDQCQRNCAKTKDMFQHPQKYFNKVKDTTKQVRNTVEEISDDITFISEKVGDLMEITPQVANIVKETKDTFHKENK